MGIAKGDQPIGSSGQTWGLPALTEPARWQSCFKSLEETGLAGFRHVLEEPLPIGINSGALEQGVDGLDDFAYKLLWTRL